MAQKKLAEVHTPQEKTQLAEFSFGLSDSEMLAEYVPPTRKTVQETVKGRRGRSTAGEVAVAFLILAAAVVSSLGINREMMVRQFPQIAAALHLTIAPKQVLPEGADAHVRVWADLKTALYYCPGAPLYGQTRNGRYLSQADALRANFEPAQRSQCTASVSLSPGGAAHR